MFTCQELLQRTSFLGFLNGEEQLAYLYRNATIYVSSFFSDGNSISLLEAKANGLTIVE